MAFDGTIPIRFRTKLVVGADVVEEDVLAETVVVFAMVMNMQMGVELLNEKIMVYFGGSARVDSNLPKMTQSKGPHRDCRDSKMNCSLTWKRRYGRWRRSRIII